MKKVFLSVIALLLSALNLVYSQAQPDSVFNALLRNASGGWIAGDATFSIALPEQKTLWLFGDSFIGTVNPADSSINTGAKMIRNCAVLQDGDSLISLYGGTFANPTDFVTSLTPDSSWFWPEHGLIENDTLKIFFSEFKLGPGPAGFNFKYNAAYIARFAYPEIVLVDLTRLPYYDSNGLCYGNSVLVENGYTYIYGRKETDTVYHISYAHVARVPVGNITAPWEFFNGVSWVSNPVETKKIASEAVSQQFGVFKLNEKYVLVTQEIWFSRKIHSLTSAFLYGPYSNRKLLYQTPLLYPGTFTYNAFPHPQFNEDDKLLISYNTNGDFWGIFNNVETYRPLFIRVPFTMIDPTYVSVEEFQEKKSESENHVIVLQNYPNPANTLTKVEFIVTQKEFVSLKLYSSDGKLIRTYVNKLLIPGNYQVDIDVSNLKSGVYNYQINDTSFRLIKK
jgi:hypothetical protein